MLCPVTAPTTEPPHCAAVMLKRPTPRIPMYTGSSCLEMIKMIQATSKAAAMCDV